MCIFFFINLDIVEEDWRMKGEKKGYLIYEYFYLRDVE